MIITEATAVAPGITARLNKTGWVAVDLSYEADPVAFTPQIIETEKARMPDWMWEQEYCRNFSAQVGKPVFAPAWLRMQEPYITPPLWRFTWQRRAKKLVSDQDGDVLVWIHPESQPPGKPPGMETVVRSFAMGLDIGEGVGRSDSAIVGFVGDTKEQAFEFRSNELTPNEMGSLAAALGRMFNQALVLCVRKMHGLTTIREMIDTEGYGRLWMDTIKDKYTEVTSDRIGWRGAEASDENLFGPWRKAIQENLVTIHSAELKHQLGQYVFDEFGRIVHQTLVNESVQLRQRHGDVAVAGGLAWRAACDLPLFEAQVPIDDAPYQSLNWRKQQRDERNRRSKAQEEERWL